MIYDLEELGGAVLLDGLEDAILGASFDDDGTPHIVYSVCEIIKVLCRRDGMSYDESVEFFSLNIDAWYPGHNPIFVYDVCGVAK